MSASLGTIRRCSARDLDRKRPGHTWCLYTKRTPRRVLGRHRSKAAAARQERAIQVRKRGG